MFGSAVSENQRKPLDQQRAKAVFEEFRIELERFLLGLCGDPAAAEDVLQTTFAKLLEQGGAIETNAMKPWLFRVSYNGAMLVARKRGVERRAYEQISRYADASSSEDENPESRLERSERIQTVRRAIEKLSMQQQEIVRLRIYENKKFTVIAEQLGVPLGTVLSRMHAATKKLNQLLTGKT